MKADHCNTCANIALSVSAEPCNSCCVTNPRSERPSGWAPLEKDKRVYSADTFAAFRYYAILGYRYLARDASNYLYAYDTKPYKSVMFKFWTAKDSKTDKTCIICCTCRGVGLGASLAPEIRWEDERPVELSEVLTDYKKLIAEGEVLGARDYIQTTWPQLNNYEPYDIKARYDDLTKSIKYMQAEDEVYVPCESDIRGFSTEALRAELLRRDCEQS